MQTGSSFPSCGARAGVRRARERLITARVQRRDRRTVRCRRARHACPKGVPEPTAVFLVRASGGRARRRIEVSYATRTRTDAVAASLDEGHCRIPPLRGRAVIGPLSNASSAFFNALRLLATTILPGILQASANSGPVPHHRAVTVQLRLAQQLRQLCDVGSDAPGFGLSSHAAAFSLLPSVRRNGHRGSPSVQPPVAHFVLPVRPLRALPHR